ncbi:unnamed protein product [Rotaria sp. Silwood2]|nr:unnamed protein product [Rotaria sp. Silwood2]
MLQHLFFLLAPCARIFAGPTNYVTATNSIPVSVAEADLDGVNGLDIVVANSGTDNVGVLLNNGDGTFAPEVTYSTGAGSKPMSVFLANVDGVPGVDIVVANSGTDNVGVLSGNGAGGFAAQQTFSTGVGSKPMSVFVANVGGTADADIVVANSGTDNVGVLYGNGAGGFVLQPAISTGVGSKPMSVYVAFVGGTAADADIVVANSGTDNVGVFLSTATGAFAPQQIYTTGAGSTPMSVFVIQVDGAGNPDIVVANSGTNNVGVLLNNGAGTFAAQVTYATGLTPMFLATADLDGDTDLDIVVANRGTNNVGVFKNNGDGTFTAQVTYTTGDGSAPMSVFLANVDGVNGPDIIVANSGTNNVGVLLNNGAGAFAAQVTYATGAGSKPMSVFLADVDNDGDQDIVVANWGTDNVGVLLNNGAGTFAAQVLYATIAGSKPISVYVVDVNNANGRDIVVANSGTNNVGVLLNNGAGIFGAELIYGFLANSAPSSVVAADVDGDGDFDIGVANSGTNNVGVLLNPGNGVFPALQTVYGTLAGSAPSSVKAADVNGDGKIDMVVADKNTNNFGVVLGNGDGTFAAAQVTYATGTGSAPVSLVAGDLNLDGSNDVAVANSGTNTVGVFIGVCQ